MSIFVAIRCQKRATIFAITDYTTYCNYNLPPKYGKRTSSKVACGEDNKPLIINFTHLKIQVLVPNIKTMQAENNTMTMFARLHVPPVEKGANSHCYHL